MTKRPDGAAADDAPRVPWYNDPLWRGYFFQALTLLVVAAVVWKHDHNTEHNPQKPHLAPR